MCVASMISNHYYDKFPSIPMFPYPTYLEYQELLRKARLYDEMNNQKDCIDPLKDKWHNDLVTYMQNTSHLKDPFIAE